jgi:uroporphyrinogen III methyltransferase/synthase
MSDPRLSADGSGRVWFVGAGPGAPDLLTLRAVRVLELADCIVHDLLVPPELLDTLRPDCERIAVCRSDLAGRGGTIDQGEAVGRMLVQLAGQGRSVVRLKGGDPAVFARLAEEVLPLERAGIPFEIVPGITAATAAAAAVALPLTSRSDASSVTLITGHRASPPAAMVSASAADFSCLETRPGTIVVYMGLEEIDRWSESLLAAGVAAETPVAVVSRCSWPDEQTCTTTLAGLRSDPRIRLWPSPAVIIVGKVVRPRAAADASGGAAFGAGALAADGAATGPLAGRRVLVTRPAAQAVDLLHRLGRCGARAVCLPLIEILPPPTWEHVDRAIATADSFDWIVFSSSNGVESFASRLATRGDARLLGTARLAAVGPQTAEALVSHRLACDLVPMEHSARGLLDAFSQVAAPGRFLLLQADRGRDTLADGLSARGHHVERVTAYLSRDVSAIDAECLAQLDRDPVDWIILSSPAITSVAIRHLGERMAGWRIACNSLASAELLIAAGLPPTVTSVDPSLEAVLAAMQTWEENAAVDTR